MSSNLRTGQVRRRPFPMGWEEQLACFVRPASVAASGTIVLKIKVVVHDAEEGGYWAEIPRILGCATQGDTMDKLMRNLHEAIEGCLAER